MANDLKLDIFPHIFPAEFFERMQKIAGNNPALAAVIMRWMHIPVLWDLDARKTMMKQFKGYKQVLTLSLPAIEFLAGPDETPALAKLANDGMAEIVAQCPDLFPAFVASLPMNNVQASLDEMDRAITKLGAKGIQVFTNVNGRPLDEPEFYPIFERCVKKYDLPIWLHPARTSKFADYPTESKSKYEIWWLFGWPYETSACMARMAFSGMFKKLPNMKVITHHLGAMAPYFVERIALGMDQMGLRTHDEDYVSLRKNLGKRPVDLFKMFYGDTAINGSASALQCGLDFFGADRVLFGTDCPFDPEGGPGFIRATIKAMGELDLPEAVERKIYYENAFRLLHMNLALSPGGKKPPVKAKKK
jgi:predicted TIM-barrel fold metal-dependent hydrolase